MSFDEVRQRLARWRYQAASAVMSPDRLHLFHTWDFTPPSGSNEKPLRITFDNGTLVVWGEAAVFNRTEDNSQSA